MDKLLAICLALTLLTICFGCGDDDDDDSANPSDDDTADDDFVPPDDDDDNDTTDDDTIDDDTGDDDTTDDDTTDDDTTDDDTTDDDTTDDDTTDDDTTDDDTTDDDTTDDDTTDDDTIDDDTTDDDTIDDDTTDDDTIDDDTIDDDTGDDDTTVCYDEEIVCDSTFSGDTTGLTSRFDGYSCNTWNETGPEKIYLLHLDVQTSITVTRDAASFDSDLFLIDDCDDPDTCLDAGDNSLDYADLPPGDHYIVVDGYNGGAGTYTFSIACVPEDPLQKEELVADFSSTTFMGGQAFVMDEDGYLHIVYVKDYNIYYLTNASGSWVSELVADTDYTLRDPSIALRYDDDGKSFSVSIIYRDTDSVQLMYATNISGSWVNTVVATGGESYWYPSILADSTGTFHLIYNKDPVNPTSTKQLIYRTYDGSTWSDETIVDAGENIGEPSLQIVEATEISPQITYYEKVATEYYVGKYATKTGEGWNIDIVIDIANEQHFACSSLTIDNHQDPHVLGHGSDPLTDAGYLEYSTRDSGIWSTVQLEYQSTYYYYPSLTIDESDYLHGAFDRDRSLYYIHDMDGDWEAVPLELGSSGYLYGIHTNIITADGWVYILTYEHIVDTSTYNLWLYTIPAGYDWPLHYGPAR